MSLIGTLAKVAIGVAVVKGVGSVMKNRQGTTSASGGLFGGPHSPSAQADAGGNSIEDVLGGILSGGRQNQSGQHTGGGLGGLLESLSGGTGGQGGGLADTLRTAAQRGGLGDLLGGLGGAAAARQTGNANPNTNPDAGGNKPERSFGDTLNQSLSRRGEPEVAPTFEQEAAAGLMLRAMIQAAKSDGRIDDAEREKLLGQLGDISPQERDFVAREMQAEVDVQGLARQVPPGLERQVYAMSVLGIDLDSHDEAQYLHQLATTMNIARDDVNAIHDQLGVQRIYQ